MRTRRIAHGIIDLLRANPVEVTFTGVDHADATDLEFLSLAARRGLAFTVVGHSTFQPETGDQSYHDSRAALLENEFSLRLGEVLYHRRRGSSPSAAIAAYKEAIDHCMGEAFYDAGLALVEELAGFADPADHYWVQTQRADFLFLLGRPAEVEPIYYDLLSRSTAPFRHMIMSYTLAMLYTRLYPDRDHHRARAHANTAVAIATALNDPFHLVFMHNGKALVEMHLGNLDESLRLVTSGIELLDEKLPAEQHRLHRSVLRHNRGQLLAALGRLDEARAEFDHVIEQDPFYAEYRFDRANLLQRMGKPALARADYEVAMRLSPPFPELYYNRGDLRCTLGDLDGAIADFRYVLDLEPDYLEARLALAALLDPADAAELLRDGCEIGSGSEPRLQVALGLSLMDADPAAARLAFDAALALDPGSLEALVNRAVLAFETGDVEGAVAGLDRALELSPGNPDVLYNRGFAHEKAGRPAQAQADYRSALDRPGADREALLDGLARCEAAVGDGERACK
jgi:tetratricopeptide (TPR) repeat protein